MHTVFIGGGTPSLFAPEQIDRLLGDVRALLPLEAGCEITLEANPGTFERDRFRGYRAAGVTRLSVGVQSFDDRALAALGRVHDAAQARAALAEAREVFETFNIDLMYALPGRRSPRSKPTSTRRSPSQPPHLSIYHLTIEPNTLLREPPAAGPARRGRRLRHARPHRRARRRGGAGALRGVGLRAAGPRLPPQPELLGVRRLPRHRRRRARQALVPAPRAAPGALARPGSATSLQALAGQPVAQEDEVERQALPFEFMLNALRLKDGFALARFGERTGLPLTAIAAPLAEAEARGLLGRDLQRAWPTARGFDFLSDLQALFLPPAPRAGN